MGGSTVTSPTSDQIISDVIKREGGLSHDPADAGGLTYEGISRAANPDLFANGQLPSDSVVRQRYEEKYVMGPGFDQITDSKLKAQLIDFGVNSGPMIAIQALQRVVGVVPDGVLGPETLAAIAKLHPDDVNLGVAVERIRMIGRIVGKNPSQAKFVSGWLNRATEFICS